VSAQPPPPDEPSDALDEDLEPFLDEADLETAFWIVALP
jgi:hypothetical protein